MSDTPRTDAAAWAVGFASPKRHVVDADLTRTLERELTALSGERSEWLCAKCQCVHLPQPGRTILQPCPDCGSAMTPSSQNLRLIATLRAEVERKQAALEDLIDYFELYSSWPEPVQDDAAFELSDKLNAARRAVLPVGGEG